MHVEVRSVTEDSSSAAAVAQLKDDLKADSFIVLSGDLVSDVPLKVHTIANLCFLTNCHSQPVLPIISHANNVFPNFVVWWDVHCTQRCCKRERLTVFTTLCCLGAEASLPVVQALAASHYVTEATVTVLLKEKRISPASETKPGKAPKNVDYVGVFHLNAMMHWAVDSCSFDTLDLQMHPPCITCWMDAQLEWYSICFDNKIERSMCWATMHHSTCQADKRQECYMVINTVADVCDSPIASPPFMSLKPFTFVTGLDTQQKQLMFIAGSTPEARRQVRVPLAALQDGRLSLRTDLMDAHLYIFHKRTFFKALEARPAYESIRQVKWCQAMIKNCCEVWCWLFKAVIGRWHFGMQL